MSVLSNSQEGQPEDMAKRRTSRKKSNGANLGFEEKLTNSLDSQFKVSRKLAKRTAKNLAGLDFTPEPLSKENA